VQAYWARRLLQPCSPKRGTTIDYQRLQAPNLGVTGEQQRRGLQQRGGLGAGGRAPYGANAKLHSEQVVRELSAQPLIQQNFEQCLRTFLAGDPAAGHDDNILGPLPHTLARQVSSPTAGLAHWVLWCSTGLHAVPEGLKDIER